MRRLCFGGTFDPIHHAHLICCRAAAEAAGYNRVVLIPNAQQPGQKDVKNAASAEHRFAMCRLAVAGDPLFEVSAIEVERGGTSYTIDTARRLAARWGERIAWMIGGDRVAGLPRWHDAAALAAEVDFVAVARPGWPTVVPVGWSVRVVTAPLIDVSSTAIRDRVAGGRSTRYLLPDAVGSYVADQRLYDPPA